LVAGHSADVWTVRRFREKPDEPTARSFLETGSFVWNSGIFVWRAARIVELLEQFQPEMHSGLARLASRAKTAGWETAINEGFAGLPSISIDHGVLEPMVASADSAGSVVVIPATFEWDDVGSWQALPKALGTDAAGNTTTGLTSQLDTECCVIRTTGDHLIATIGLKDFVVVHTADATLIAPASDEAALRKMVAQLAEQGYGRYL
jgi:mannose-1-phosphate guanylyltransferase